jgi:hypothetical protein
MDYDYNNIKEAQERFKSSAIPPPKAYYIRGDSSKLIFPNTDSGLQKQIKYILKNIFQLNIFLTQLVYNSVFIIFLKMK